LPPLYKLKKGKQIIYAQDDAEKDKHVEQMGKQGLIIQRFKGLGEMNPDQLWDTTMDPSVRFLKRIMIEDAVEAEKAFTDLMGEEVEPRRKYIQENAMNVINLDV
jgi:DNA gyrase subunit B